MKIKKYNEWKNYEVDDIDEILNWVFNNVDSKEIPELTKNINKISNSVNENIFKDIFYSLRRWFDEKMMDYFINKKKNFYTELIGKLSIFDLTTIDDVVKNYPGFDGLQSIYLAGGMDKAADVGAGWRNVVEWTFEYDNPSKPTGLEDIKIDYMGKIYEKSPSYIIDGHHIDLAIKQGIRYLVNNGFSFPVIFNPVRKEVDRTKNAQFAKNMIKFKTGGWEENPEETFGEINKVFSSSIEPEDEKIVTMCDAIFFGVNEYASAGTFGELQQASFLRKPIFAWYETGWKIEGHSPWTLPHITKIMRSVDDMKIFVKTMIDYNK